MVARVCCGLRRQVASWSRRWRPVQRLSATSAVGKGGRRAELYRARTFAAVYSQSEERSAAAAQSETQLPLTCPGCGIRLQQTLPDRPGYVCVPKKRMSSEAETNNNETPSWDKDLGFSAVGDLFDDQGVGRGAEVDALAFRGDDLSSTAWTSGRAVGEEEREEEELPPIVCERCFSLRNYGKLKNVDAEELVPKFSVERVLKPKIAKDKGKKVVVVCVVDVFDFDGSLPAEELKSLFPSTSRLPAFLEFVLVGNKVDLVLKNISREALEVWVRTRLKAYQLPFAKTVHLVSSQTMLGVRQLMIGLRKDMTRNTDCYVIGVQNAGKSSMLNALRRLIAKGATSQVTTAPLPGTTLGFVNVPGLPVEKSCRVFDTPGLENRTQITHLLNAEEVTLHLIHSLVQEMFVQLKLVQPRRALKPRTYRFGPGNSLLIGGLARLDLDSCQGTSLYATIWVSDEIVCYLGKTQNVEAKLQKHRGHLLRPPVEGSRLSEELHPSSLSVTGSSWKASSTDIVIAGLGWIGIGCKGEAKFTVWTFRDVRLKTRPSLLTSFASVFQKPGFSDSIKSRGLRGS